MGRARKGGGAARTGAWRVIVQETFAEDVRAQAARLRRARDDRRLAGLEPGLREARQLLQTFPLAGAAADPRLTGGPRRLILRRLPFVIWYVAVPGAREVRLLRFFHVRQREH